MRLLLVSDTESRYIWDYFDKSVFAGVELILSCGDLSAHYLEFLVTMIGAPLYYVPGNHDTSFVNNPPGGCINTDGALHTVNGVRILGFGGCRSNRRDIHQYTENDMARRISRLGRSIKRAGGFDILLTHAPAFKLGDGQDSFHTGFECFVGLLDKFTPKYHIFGHQHKSYRYDTPPASYKSTCLINAFGYKLIDF